MLYTRTFFILYSRAGLEIKIKIEGIEIGSCKKNQMDWSFYINQISQNYGFKNMKGFVSTEEQKKLKKKKKTE